MRIVCGQLRGFCLNNEWAASAFAALGAGIFIATLWAVMEFNVIIKAWIVQNLLLHGLLFGAATLADIMLIFGFLCLGFSECAVEDKNCAHAYRGRRSNTFSGAIRWVESLGKNPRRHPRKT